MKWIRKYVTTGLDMFKSKVASKEDARQRSFYKGLQQAFEKADSLLNRNVPYRGIIDVFDKALAEEQNISKSLSKQDAIISKVKLEGFNRGANLVKSKILEGFSTVESRVSDFVAKGGECNLDVITRSKVNSHRNYDGTFDYKNIHKLNNLYKGLQHKPEFSLRFMDRVYDRLQVISEDLQSPVGILDKRDVSLFKSLLENGFSVRGNITDFKIDQNSGVVYGLTLEVNKVVGIVV